MEEEKQRPKLPSTQESLFEGHLSFSASAGLLVFSTELRFLPGYKGRKRLQKGGCELLDEGSDTILRKGCFSSYYFQL